MVRVEDLDITFFHNPKNAGTSIAKWLTNNVYGEEYLDDLRHESPLSLKPLFGDFGWSFCCVRNPWDRMVSWYNFFKEQDKIEGSFENFIDRSFRSDRSAKYYKPMNRQMQFVRNVDYVIRYENLREDFKMVQERCTCFTPLPHYNRSKHDKYVDYYTNRDYINIVGEYYAEEIDVLEYKFGG